VEAVRKLLESLGPAARRCPEPVEVIVVDDSDGPDADLIEQHCAAAGARYLRGPRHVGAKRNLGVRISAYDLVQFIDSDCQATPELLARHSAALRGAPRHVGAVAGPAELEDPEANAVIRVMRRGTKLNGDLEAPSVRSRPVWAATCNLMVRRQAFDAVGGFTEQSLTVVAGEDVDLGLRLSAAGHAIVCEPTASVIHSNAGSDSVARVYRRLLNYGQSEQWLCAVHPGHRRFKLNLVSTLGAVAVVAGARGRSLRPVLRAVPVAAGAMIAARTWQATRGRERSARALLETAACVTLEASFDLGAFVAACRMGRPGLLWAGFSVDEAAGPTTEGQDQRA
jgi:glycosyltransferase involved in cell wall biosynthesis